LAKFFNKNRIGRIKVYLERGKGHFGTVTLIFTVLTLLGVYKDGWAKIFFDYPVLIAVAIVLFYAIIIAMGRFDYVSRIMDEENKIQAEYNPVLTEILNRIKKIEKKI